jgi:hypothetical protein
MLEKLNILILHNMGNPKKWRTSVKERELCMVEYAPNHNYIIHNASVPIPSKIKNIQFHGIVIGPTFLYSRMYPDIHKKIITQYAFIKESKAYKIALPQDEYDRNIILEDWLIDWNIDKVFTVLPDNIETLYPRLYDTGKIELGYTGYISDSMLERSKSVKKLTDREIDISYRSKVSYFGITRYQKGIIGDVFLGYLGDSDLKTDISTNSNDAIPGKLWLDFVENSKFVLCGNSGSSILDNDGSIMSRVKKYVKENPNSKFEDVKEACFCDVDELDKFTAISPRNIEAALLETIQICIPGKYNGIMIEYEDYIPFHMDGSNINEVLEIIDNDKRTLSIAKSCKNKILQIDGLYYRNHVNTLIQLIRSKNKFSVYPFIKKNKLRLYAIYEILFFSFKEFYYFSKETKYKLKVFFKSLIKKGLISLGLMKNINQ